MAAPNLAISELCNRVSKLSLAELSELSGDELTGIQTVLAEAAYNKLDAKCSRDPLYWAQNYSATENPHWEKQGVPFIAPFPNKSYFRPLFNEFAKLKHRTPPILFIPKSREMITSWSLMCYGTHRAQWSKAEVVVQTSKEEKAGRLVEYAKILYRNQPEWLRNGIHCPAKPRSLWSGKMAGDSTASPVARIKSACTTHQLRYLTRPRFCLGSRRV